MNPFNAEHVGSTKYQTTKALLLHEAKNSHASSTVFTVHDVDQGENGPMLSPGKLLGQNDEQHILDALMGNIRHHCQNVILPTNVLVSNPTTLVWYRKGYVGPIHFYAGKKKIFFDVPWPTMVFMVSDGTLSIAAVKTKSRPTAKTPLFHAPVMNVYADGSLCTGTAKCPQTWTISDIDQWERVIYRTNNSHVNQPQTLLLPDIKNVTTAAHLRFWRNLSRLNSNAFPSEHLAPMDMRLQKWLR